MARIDPTKKAQKWANAMSGATQAYKDGINGTEGNPMEMAVAKKDTLKTRFNQSIDDGTWERSLAGRPKSDWSGPALAVGAARLADGASKGQPKMQAYLTKAAPVIEQIRATVRAMPNATDADRRARMLANMEMMKQLKGLGSKGR